MVKAIIFDLDDTLLWDNRSVNEALKATCDYAAAKQDIKAADLEHIIRLRAPEIYASFNTIDYVENIGIGYFEALWGDFKGNGVNEQQLAKMAPEYRLKTWMIGLSELDVNDEAFAGILADMFKVERKKRIYLYVETITILKELSEKYKLILLTNGSSDLQRIKLSLSPELSPYLDDIIISGDFGKGKPDPSLFAHVLERNELTKEEAIMVGDNLKTDILGASRSSIRSVWINHDNRKVEDVSPTYEISRLKEIIPVIKSLENN